MDLGYDVVVMVTGIVLVFLILVLLMLIIMLEGKIFDGLNASKKAKAERKAQESVKAAPAVQAAKPAAAPVQEPAPVVEQGIPGEIVAAIAAAIAAISGGKYTLRAVRRAGADARGSWGRAGVNDVTSPF